MAFKTYRPNKNRLSKKVIRANSKRLMKELFGNKKKGDTNEQDK